MLGSNMSRLTRRHVLKTGGAVTFAGYAVGVDKVFAQVIKTDTQGIVAGDVQVKIGDYAMPIYEGASCDAQWRADSAGDLGDLGRS